MNDGVYFDQNGNEVIVINGFEYSREENPLNWWYLTRPIF